MEVAFDFGPHFQQQEPIERLDRAALARLNPRKCAPFQRALDQLGALSAQAQGLKRQLTTYEKLIDSPDEQVLYLLWKRSDSRPGVSYLIGLLKVGRKRLFLRDRQERLFETSPLCVLDFFIHETMQRRGNGKALFDRMLETEETEPSRLAIDRPSKPMQDFLAKHYQLKDPIWQSTNFAVFPPLFEGLEPSDPKEDYRSGRQRSDKSRAGSVASTVQNSPVLIRRTPVSRSGDTAADIIHGTALVAPRPDVPPDSATGRKNTRDFGHNRIW